MRAMTYQRLLRTRKLSFFRNAVEGKNVHNDLCVQKQTRYILLISKFIAVEHYETINVRYTLIQCTMAFTILIFLDYTVIAKRKQLQL